MSRPARLQAPHGELTGGRLGFGAACMEPLDTVTDKSPEELTAIWNDYFVFTVVRNPYDRMLSSYKFLLRKVGGWVGGWGHAGFCRGLDCRGWGCPGTAAGLPERGAFVGHPQLCVECGHLGGGGQPSSCTDIFGVFRECWEWECPAGWNPFWT